MQKFIGFPRVGAWQHRNNVENAARLNRERLLRYEHKFNGLKKNVNCRTSLFDTSQVVRLTLPPHPAKRNEIQ